MKGLIIAAALFVFLPLHLWAAEVTMNFYTYNHALRCGRVIVETNIGKWQGKFPCDFREVKFAIKVSELDLPHVLLGTDDLKITIDFNGRPVRFVIERLWVIAYRIVPGKMRDYMSFYVGVSYVFERPLHTPTLLLSGPPPDMQIFPAWMRVSPLLRASPSDIPWIGKAQARWIREVEERNFKVHK